MSSAITYSQEISFNPIEENNCIEFNYDLAGNRISALLTVCLDQNFTRGENLKTELAGNLKLNNENIYNDTDVLIYPNPVFESLSIVCDDRPEIYFLCLNSSGQIIQEGNLSNGSSRLDVRNWKPGTYYIQVGRTKEDFIKTYKITVL